MKELCLIAVFAVVICPVGFADEQYLAEIPKSVIGLQNPKAVNRMWAADDLASIGPRAQAAVPALIEVLGDSDAGVRQAAARALGCIVNRQNERVVKSLLQTIRTDKDRSVRRAAGGALVNIAKVDASVIAGLIGVMDAPPGLAAPALQDATDTLGKMGPRAIPSLNKAMVSAKPVSYHRVFGARALRDMGPAAKEAVPTLIAMMRERRPGTHEVRKSSAEALAAIGPEAKTAIPVLVEALKHDDGDSGAVRHRVLTALLSIDPHNVEALSVLNEFLNEPESDWRIQLGMAAVKARPEDAMGLKVLLEYAEKTEVNWRSWRLAAIEAIARLGEPAKGAVPALIRNLRHQDELVRSWSAYALGEIGPAAKEATPALAKAIADDDPSVRYAAARALARISPE